MPDNKLRRSQAYANAAANKRGGKYADLLLVGALLSCSPSLASAQGVSVEAEAGNTSRSAIAMYDTNTSGGRFAQVEVSSGSTSGNDSWVNISPPVQENPADPFGFQTIRVAPSDPRVVYVGTSAQGFWRTLDGGETWEKRNGWHPGDNCDGHGRVHFLDTGRQAGMIVDHTNHDIVWTTNLYGCRQGVFKSTDGGATWKQMLSHEIEFQINNNISNLAIDPSDPQHVLAGSRDTWKDGRRGFFETLDGGETWILHVNANFKENNVFFIDSNTWLIGVLYDGFYRTSDKGQTWTKVSNVELAHGVATLIRVPNGTLYVSGSHHLQRSTDNGLSWQSVAPYSQDEYMAVAHDGTYLYTCPSNTGTNSVSPDPPYYRSPISDGVNWIAWPQPGILVNGPAMMELDPVRRILYSANWAAGVYKIQL